MRSTEVGWEWSGVEGVAKVTKQPQRNFELTAYPSEARSFY